MTSSKKIDLYKQLVEKKYNVYNSLFMNLPYDKIENTGMLIPILSFACEKGLQAGKSPLAIIDHFFEQHTDIKKDKEKLDFFFRVIQYVERQIVLFDSVEDVHFEEIQKLKNRVTLKDFFNRLSNDKNESEAMLTKLKDFSVRTVFTAHPTQFYPLSVLEIIKKLRNLIKANELDDIDVSIQQLGLTSFINSQKPTPEQEARNIIYYMRYTYYEAISKYYQHVKKEVVQDENFANHDMVKMGFWPGGDRDGNPFVTAETTAEVADELRMTLMKCYYNDLKEMQYNLTFKKVEEILNPLRDRLYKAIFDKTVSIKYTDILDPLVKAKESLITHYNSLYIDNIERLIDSVKIFRTHFASLDIRQDHSVHLATMQAIIKKHKLSKKSFDNLSSDELLEILFNSEVKLSHKDYDDPLISDTIKNITQLKKIQAKNGEKGCCRYIISNSEDIFSVLFVYTLFKWCGYKKEDIHFDIVPLFETMKGMDDSQKVLQFLFDNKEYRTHLSRRKDVQNIMLGFSDGTKDGGYLKANWNIFNTKEKLSIVCDKNAIKAVFFDGRGGPPARGGGKTHRFYASQGKHIANNEIQLTIQGQTITSTYGTVEQFTHNCEQMLTAGLSNELNKDKKEDMRPDQRYLMDELSKLSFEKYDALKQHPQFLPYLENMSTLQYYKKANIGSRPGKRGNKKKLELTDLRAISFVGSWSQLKQNVPGYFGIGTAIATLKANGRLEEVKALFNDLPFFKALILNSMMSLTKSYFPLTAYMKEHKVYGEFWQVLYNEYQLSCDMLLEISGYETLMEEEPFSKASVAIREKIVLPLLTIQQYALQQIIEKDKHTDTYKKIVTRSLYGNINASRNSA